MIKNYFVTAFRNLWRNKTFSIINILGLAIGISASLVIFLIVHYEFSYDAFVTDSNRVFRVVMDAKFNGMEGHSTGVQAPLGEAVAHEMTGVELTVPVMSFQGDGSVKVEVPRPASNSVIFKKQPFIVFTNQQYFQLLPYRWLAGSPQSSLQAPFSVVLTKARAQTYFPNTPMSAVIGKAILYNNNLPLTVTGVVDDLKEVTHFSSLEFISFPTIAKTNLSKTFMMDVWDDWMAYSMLYVKLSPGVSPITAEVQLAGLLHKYNGNANKDPKNSMRFHLQPLSDIHFNSIYQGFGNRIVSKTTLYGLVAIAIFLLLLGCINFINLTTAQSVRRAKEIGIRKTMGSSKKQLVMQFLGETLTVTILATLLSLALTPMLLGMFKSFIPEGLQLNRLEQPSLFVFLLILIAAVSFFAGLYPALVLSGYNPVAVLKNQSFSGTAHSRSTRIRQSLTVTQFVIAQFFVIATLMVSKQIHYSLNADIGFNKDAIITFNLPRDTVRNHPRQLLNNIKSLPGVAIASTGFLSPADQGAAFTNISYLQGSEEIKPSENVQIRWGNPDYISLYQIKLLAGRNVRASDTISEMLVNETFTRAVGFRHAEEAVGKLLLFNKQSIPIVGVMKDFHDQSMNSGISAMAFGNRGGSTIHIKLKPNQTGRLWSSTIAAVQAAFREMYPEEDFNYKFVDDMIARFYESEQRTARLLTWATGLTVFISCLGLLGLVIYTTNTRTKEIGIRKILGASVRNIVAILSTDFMRLVMIAFVIAAPLAWWAVYSWLQNFAYRTSISWWIFAVSGLGMLAMAMLTLAVQVIRTAIVNPVKSLRSE